ncbi:MAG: hypothetical protein HY975_01315 [Candidatus Kerfeldbacteria bacterium]|nr:hypothetical protein [Candidatus Kerfeldbacteria bacterium]
MPTSLFILGREPELSVAELEAAATRWPGTVSVINPEVAFIDHQQLLPSGTLDRLGGSTKLATVLDRWPLSGDVVATVEQHLTPAWMIPFFSSERIEFGVSGYGLSNRERGLLQKIALHVKKDIHAAGRPVRFVTSKEPQLSAVTVRRNGLLNRGHEFILVPTDHDIIVARTDAVQDYQAYGLRDFGRPAANAKSGMLPPKVAQMMLNIAGVQADDILLDPFCGTGTVLQEAALLGVHELHGSDAEQRAVKDSQENIRWLVKEFSGLHLTVDILLRDAREISLMPSVIVTEPYLGKPLRGHEPPTWLAQQAHDLEKLYLQCFQHWRKHLQPGAQVVMIWPEFVSPAGPIALKLDQVVEGLGFQRDPLLSSHNAALLKHDDVLVVTYGRDDARVRRQIRRWTFRGE